MQLLKNLGIESTIEPLQQAHNSAWYSSVNYKYHPAIAEAEEFVSEWGYEEPGKLAARFLLTALTNFVPIFAFNKHGKNRLVSVFKELGNNEQVRKKIFTLIQHNGLIAPFLDVQWKLYRDMVGEIRWKGELQYAYCCGFPMAPVPLALADSLAEKDPYNWSLWTPDEYALMPHLYPHWQQSHQLPAASVATEQIHSAAYVPGIATQLGAIDVQPTNYVDAPMSSDMPLAATPTNAAELLAVLEAQCPDLLRLVKAPPIRLVGAQRTGKSTVARKLSLLRSIFLPGHAIAWATPHREADNLVPESLNPFGVKADGSKDMSSIERVWQAVQKVLDKGQQLNLSAVWDEFGSYDVFEDEDCLGRSLKSMLREASKHNYYPILIVHGDQAAFYPGLKNFLTTLQNTTVKIETFGEAIDAFGTMRPTGEIEITWLDKTTSAFKLPDWLTEELLLSLQPTVVKPAVLDAIAVAVPAVDQRAVIGTPATVQETVSESPHVAVEAVQPTAEETLQQRVSKKLLEKLKASNGEWVTNRDLVTNTFSQPKDREMAKAILELAVSKGLLKQEAVTNPNGTESIRYQTKAST